MVGATEAGWDRLPGPPNAHHLLNEPCLTSIAGNKCAISERIRGCIWFDTGSIVSGRIFTVHEGELSWHPPTCPADGGML